MNKQTSAIPATLLKSPTGITGPDEIIGGGLPSGRPTLVSGSAGCGRTMLGVEFLACAATQFGEPGVFMMLEENAKELSDNVRSLGFDLDELVEQKKIVLDHVHIERSEIEETGESTERAAAEPIKKIIGDLSNEERVLVGFDLQPVMETA